MAVLCADTKTHDLCARTLAQRKLPVENRLGSGDFDPTSNKIKVMTMKVSKGLEFPVVALPGVGHMPAARGQEGSGVGVLCGGYEGDAEAACRYRWPIGIWKATLIDGRMLCETYDIKNISSECKQRYLPTSQLRQMLFR